MSTPAGSPRIRRTAEVIVVSSVMFTFISYWRTAAVVLCDLASTAYYIGGIVEAAIGPAAPWFILAVMLFSYAVRSVYIESCSLFVRGGVYRVVKEAMGGFLAKLSVSALMFDYILTGPISGVSAGQYIMGLVARHRRHARRRLCRRRARATPSAQAGVPWSSPAPITLYFFRQNLIGIHESSDKALKIMIATTVMAVVMLVWCGITLCVDGPVNSVPLPDLTQDRVPGVQARPRHRRRRRSGSDPDRQLCRRWTTATQVPADQRATGEQEDPLGFIGRLSRACAKLRQPGNWLSLDRADRPAASPSGIRSWP